MVKKLIIRILIFLPMIASIPSFAQENPKFDVVPTSLGNLEMHFIGHGTLMFKIKGIVVHIDPVSMYADYAALPKADMIVVSHEHGDHLDPKALEAIKKDETLFYSTETVAQSQTWAKIVKAGDKVNYRDVFSVDIVPAYNIQNVRAPGQPYHPQGSGVGFVFNFGDTRVYVAGDTEDIPEMRALKEIDIAFLPMNLPYTMTSEMVANAARAFKPKILYPYHFGNTDTNELEELLKGSGIEVRIRDLQ